MILENVKERLNTINEELQFIKECLWPDFPWKEFKRA